MNILLINPQTANFITNREYYTPSSILYLASSLREKNNINILDLNTFRIEEDNKGDIKNNINIKNDKENIFEIYQDIIINKIYDFHPSIIGMTCPFSGEFPIILNYSKKIKNIFRDIPIIIGGIHPTIFPYDILYNCPSIDYIIIGEGEESILNLIDAIRKKENNNNNEYDDEKFYGNLKKIDGFAYRYNGEIKINHKKTFIEDLDKIPFPAYDLIEIENYYHDTSKWNNPRNLPINCSIPIISSRSCPNRCNFCSMFMVMGPNIRKRSPKNVVDEIEFLYKKYDHRHFSFMDDNLTLDKSHILGICEEITKRNLNIQFETPNGLSTRTIDEEVLDAMVSAGLIRLSLAIESGSDYIRNDIMGKRLSRKKIYEVVRLTKKYKSLYVRAFFIIGMPEDTNKTLWDTYNMIKEIDIDKPIVANVLPFPGTKLFDQALRDNLFIENIDPKNLWKTESLYFTNNKSFFIKPYNLDIEELNTFRYRFDELINNCISKKIEFKKIEFKKIEFKKR